MGAIRPWSRVGPGGLLGGPPPKFALLPTTRALCYKIPQPSKPPPVREAGKRGGASNTGCIGMTSLNQTKEWGSYE